MVQSTDVVEREIGRHPFLDLPVDGNVRHNRWNAKRDRVINAKSARSALELRSLNYSDANFHQSNLIEFGNEAQNANALVRSCSEINFRRRGKWPGSPVILGSSGANQLHAFILLRQSREGRKRHVMTLVDPELIADHEISRPTSYCCATLGRSINQSSAGAAAKGKGTISAVKWGKNLRASSAALRESMITALGSQTMRVRKLSRFA